MANKFIDLAGFTYIWGKIKALLAGKADSDHDHDAGDIISGMIAADRLPKGNATTKGAVIVDDTMKWNSANPVQNQVVAKYMDTFLKLSGAKPMTGNLVIEPNSTTSPSITLTGNANASGQQAKAYFSKGTSSSADNGTKIEDRTFDGTYTRLTIMRNASSLSSRIKLNDNGTEYYLYGDHNKPKWGDISGKPTTFAPAAHNHDAGNITSGTLPVARGGTGQTTLTPAVGTQALRAIYAGTGDMTAGSSGLTTGCVYLVYE